MTEHNELFQKLEQKIAKVADLFRQSQAEKRALEQELEKTRAGAKEQSKLWELRERELLALKREREEVRARVERLLDQIDALTKGDSDR